MADEAPVSTTAAPEAAAQVSTPSSETPASLYKESAPAETTAQAATSSATAAAPSEPAPAPWWSTLGADETQAQAAVTRLQQQWQQVQPLIPYANAFAQHAAEFMEWQRSRQQKAAAPAVQQQEKPWHAQFWNPPEYNPSWEKLLRRDEAGQIVALPGTPPDVLPKYLAYAQYTNDFVEKFRNNPAETLAPMIDARAEQIAQRIVAQHLGGRDQQQTNQQFISDNNNWLYEQDQNGRQRMTQAFDPQSGRFVQQPVLSHWGRRFRDIVNEVHAQQVQRGTFDPEMQKQYALAQIRLEAMQHHAQQQAPAAQAPTTSIAPPDTRTPREKANAAFLQGNGAKKPATNGNVTPADTPVDRANFASHLLSELNAAGVKPEHFHQR